MLRGIFAQQARKEEKQEKPSGDSLWENCELSTLRRLDEDKHAPRSTHLINNSQEFSSVFFTRTRQDLDVDKAVEPYGQRGV